MATGLSAYLSRNGRRYCSAGVVLDPSDESKLVAVTSAHCTKQPNQQTGGIMPDLVIMPDTELGPAVWQGRLTRLLVRDVRSDAAAFSLPLSRAEANERGIRPRRLGKVPPVSGDPLQCSSGLWNKKYNCTTAETGVRLREGNTRTESVMAMVKSQQCHVEHGVSGSPCTDVSGNVVGLVSTLAEAVGERRKSIGMLNHPVELRKHGQERFVEGRNYITESQPLRDLLQSRTEFGKGTIQI